ncbi:flavin reductase family protein [Saccharothrix sp. HUAS TT1]|uniref:flavin reductase family protein n=1 Tax=unclassified Saccharothrix TaxID=2593673 RepID=UPI00345C1FF7
MSTTNLRDVMRNYATGVCVATTYSDGPDGRLDDAITINSLTSVSMDPPLVSMCLRPDSGFLANVRAVGFWALSILDAGTEDIARALAKDRETRSVAMRTLSTRRGDLTGALVLDSPSWLECKLADTVTVGDHVMLIGDVIGLGTKERRPPLIFLQGGFHTLSGV